MTKIEPYLIFDGNCEEAFNFYKEIFGGEFGHIGRFKDTPQQKGTEVSEEDKEKIMHVSLPIGKNMLMGSDAPKQEEGVKFGDNFSISANVDSEEEADRIFDKLSEKGRVKMPLAKTFWGDYFGMCVDKFGIHWMISYSYNEQEEK